jgi:hypothetical protein
MARLDQEKVLNLAKEMLASGEFSLDALRNRLGNPSTRTVYRTLEKWQKELGEADLGKANARRIFHDYLIYHAWVDLCGLCFDAQRTSSGAHSLLVEIIRRIVGYLSSDLQLSSVIIRGTSSSGERKPRVLTAHQKIFWDELRNIVRRAQDECLAKEIDSDVLLRTIHGSIYECIYGLSIRQVTNETYTANKIIEGLELILRQLCRTPDEPH